MKLNRQSLFNIFIFFILTIVSVWMGVSLKNEISWDFTNYHYYNAWAFFNNRLNFDIVPASFNTFLNPVIEFPLYFYIQWFNNYPTLIWALQSIWGGLMLFCVYKITTLLIDMKKITNWFLFAILCVVILSGEGVGTQLGSSANEIPVAFFILWGFYLLLKMVKIPQTQTLKQFLIAGLIMGIGLGLKQTIIPYCIASGLTLIICHKYLNKPVKSILFFALGGFMGYLIINGYFIYQYWVLYSNPMFPFLNGIFHSPYFDDFNYSDTRFLPTIKEFLIFPFLWHAKSYAISENYYTDIRLTLYYCVFMLFSLHLICSSKLREEINQNKPLKTIFVFLVLSFFIWLFMFSYMRYAVTIEIIGAIFTMLLIIHYTPKKDFFFILYSTFFTILAGALYLDFGSIYKTTEPIEQKVFVEPITLPENTLIKTYGLPTAGLVPFFQGDKKSFKILGYAQHHCLFLKGSDLSDRNQFKKMRDEIEKNHKGPVIYMYASTTYIHNFTIDDYRKIISEQAQFPGCDTWPLVIKALLRDMPLDYECRKIKTNIIKWDINLCASKSLMNTIFTNSEKLDEQNN